MSKVLAFKLIGGEEVVAEVLEEKRSTLLNNNMLLENVDAGEIHTYVVRRPHILRFQPIAPGEIGLAFVPWTLSNPTIDSVELPARSVLVTFSPSENVERQYVEQTSGIKIARANANPQGRISG